MNNNNIRYEQLQKVLHRLGYVLVSNGGNRVVYRNPDSAIDVILRRMKKNELLTPLDLLSVRNALANGGIVSKERFDSLFHLAPLELWHAIVDAEAEYLNHHGHRASILKLPVPQAYDLAKLRRTEFGPLAERVMHEGIKVFEEDGLLGIPVQLVPDANEFVFE